MNVFLIFNKIDELNNIIKEKSDEIKLITFTKQDYEKVYKICQKFPYKLKLGYYFGKLIKKMHNVDISLSDMPIYPFMHLNQIIFPNTPLIWRPTGDIWTQISSEIYGNHPQRKVFLFLTENLFEKVPAIITVSKWLKKEFQKHIKNKNIFVIYKNVDTKKFGFKNDNESFRRDLGLKQDKIILLSVIQGNFFQKIKGLFYYFKVIKRLNVKFRKDLIFLICGNGLYYPYLQKYASKLKITNIHFLGYQLLLNKIYAACDIFVHPTLLDAAPKVIREAGISRKPIVASDIGGIPELINSKHGFLLDPKNKDEFYLILQNLIEDKKLREEYGKKAYDFISNKNKISSGKLFWKILNRFQP